MKIDNPFDQKLNLQGHNMPEELHASEIIVTDTLDLAWASAQAVFEDRATPDHALKILELMLSQADRNTCPPPSDR